MQNTTDNWSICMVPSDAAIQWVRQPLDCFLKRQPSFFVNLNAFDRTAIRIKFIIRVNYFRQYEHIYTNLIKCMTDMNNLCSCLHFLDVANDSPITPAPAYRSATDDPPGTYLCSFQSKLSKAWRTTMGNIRIHTAFTTAIMKTSVPTSNQII